MYSSTNHKCSAQHKPYGRKPRSTPYQILAPSSQSPNHPCRSQLTPVKLQHTPTTHDKSQDSKCTQTRPRHTVSTLPRTLIVASPHSMDAHAKACMCALTQTSHPRYLREQQCTRQRTHSHPQPRSLPPPAPTHNSFLAIRCDHSSAWPSAAPPLAPPLLSRRAG